MYLACRILVGLHFDSLLMAQVALTGTQNLVLIITQHTTFFFYNFYKILRGDGGISPVEQILLDYLNNTGPVSVQQNAL